MKGPVKARPPREGLWGHRAPGVKATLYTLAFLSKENRKALWGQACDIWIRGGNDSEDTRGRCLLFDYKEARKAGERGASLTEEAEKGGCFFIQSREPVWGRLRGRCLIVDKG